jgi:hypothetical protein
VQRTVFLLLLAAAAGCLTTADRKPALEAEGTGSRAAESAKAGLPDEAVPAPTAEQAAEDTPQSDTPAVEAEAPASQPLERTEWTHNRRHFKKWREEIREMHREFDKIIFDLEAAGEDGTRKKPKRHLPPSPHAPPHQ